jgi:hypothetical protein
MIDAERPLAGLLVCSSTSQRDGYASAREISTISEQLFASFVLKGCIVGGINALSCGCSS